MDENCLTLYFIKNRIRVDDKNSVKEASQFRRLGKPADKWMRCIEPARIH